MQYQAKENSIYITKLTGRTHELNKKILCDTWIKVLNKFMNKCELKITVL